MKTVNSLTIVTASNNDAKNKALATVCSGIFKHYQLESYTTDSGVSETPLSDDEAVKGCLHRLAQIENKARGNTLCVAMEGLLQQETFGCFVYGWAAIKMADDAQIYYGCSGKVMIPESVYAQCSEGVKLSSVVNTFYHFPDKEREALWGTNGLFTEGIYTRVDEFTTALKCALGSLVAAKRSELEKYLID